MRILHITKKYPNALGGDAVVVANLEKEQQKRDHDVMVLTSNCDEIPADERHIKFGLRDAPAALDKITPRRLLNLGALFLKSFHTIKEAKPDVVHTHSVDMAFAASFAARRFRVPLVHTFHILTFPDPRHGWLRRKTELLFLRGARPSTVLASNATDLQHLKDADVHNARLMAHGIDLSFWHHDQPLPHDTFTFISAARLEDQKGIEYLIRAAAALKDKTGQLFKVRIVGEGSRHNELVALAEQLGVTDSIEFCGRKSPEELRDLYAASDVAVIPSLYESGPLTALEAWAMQLPVIVTPVGIFADEPEDSKRAVLVPPANPTDLAAAMQQLLTDEELRAKLRKHGFNAVQQHEWKQINRTAEGLYEEAQEEKTRKYAPNKRSGEKSAAFAPRQRTLVTGLGLASIVALLAAPQLSPTINTLVTLPLITFVPGLLALFALWPQTAKRPAITASLSAALGVLIIALEGLLLNWLLPLFGYNNPLHAQYLVPAHLIVTMLFGGLYYQDRWRGEGLTRISLRISWLRSARFVVPLLLPLLAAAGAFRLNNGASNTITIICFSLIALMAIWYVWKPKLWNASWLLFNMALALLLSTSLRSWFVSGFDISQEYQVYMTVLQNNFWDIRALPGNAYNACLSLTTLPVALQQFTGVGAEVIFKYFYQVIFALTAVLTYLIGRRFVGQRLAFLAALLYMAQAQFIGTMPAIARQEIGLLFFGLILYFLLSRRKLTRGIWILLIVLAGGTVLTHYSTTYVAFMVFAAAAIVLFVAQKLRSRLRIPRFSPVLTAGVLGRMAILLLLFAVIWYGQINQSSGNVINTLRSAASLHMPNSLLPDTGSGKAQLILGGDQEIIKPENVARYAREHDIQATIAPASVPKLKQGNAVLGWVADAGRLLLGIIIKVVLPLSPFLLLAHKKTRKKAAEIAFAGAGAVAVFAAVVILPALSANYNLQRVFQQCLMILAVTGVWALWTLLPAGRRIKTITIAAFVLGYFVLSPGSGLVNQVTGNVPPRLSYNNVGEEYSKYYVRESETIAASWLAANCQNQSAWADRYATLRLTAYGVIPYDDIRSDILSAKQGCLYLDYANTSSNLFYATYKKLPVRYTTSPSSFDRYNLIYTNSEAKVYSY